MMGKTLTRFGRTTMKLIWFIGGLLGLAFATGHVLQAAGVIGTKTFSPIGVLAIILGLAIAISCFKRAAAS